MAEQFSKGRKSGTRSTPEDVSEGGGSDRHGSPNKKGRPGTAAFSSRQSRAGKHDKGKTNQDSGKKDDQKHNKKGQQNYKTTKGGAEEAAPLFAKAICSSLQQHREAESVYMDCFLMPKEHSIYTSIKAKTKTWNDLVSNAGTGHTIGPPHLFASEGLFEDLAKQDVGALNRLKIKELSDKLSQFTEVEKQLYIRACRVKTTYDPKMIKLAIAVRGELEPYRAAICNSLIQLGAQYKSGKAPPGAFERAIQDFLKAWQH